MNYNVLLSSYFYLQDNNNYLLFNLIFNKIQIKKKTILIEALFFTSNETLPL